MQVLSRFSRFLLTRATLRLYCYTASLWFGAALILGVLVGSGQRIESIWPLFALGTLGAVAERSRVRLSTNLELSISLVPSLFAAVTFGPLEAMLVGAASLLGDLRRPYLKWAVYTPVEAITGAASGLAASLLIGLVAADLPAIALATCAAAGNRGFAPNGKGTGTRQDARASHRAVRAPVHTDRRAPLVRVCRDLAVDATPVPCSGDRSPAPVWPLPGPAPTCRRPHYRKHSP
jgi:hypothetical protein